MKNFIKVIVLVLISAFGISKSNAQTIFSLSPYGNILKSGQPFFPVGFYIDRGTVASYKDRVNEISAGASFNCINVPFVSGNDAEWTTFLDSCQLKGIYVITQLNYNSPYIGPVITFKNHPAVMGWSVGDDADNGYFTVSQLQDRQDLIKSTDPNHVTELSLTGYYLARRLAVNTYLPTADIIGYQCYPITPLPDYDVTPTNALTEAYLRIL